MSSGITPGTRLGPYEVAAKIGAGGMGEVWKATDTRLDRSVALKVLPAAFADNAQLRIRLEREAKTISQLSHPHICALFDVGEAMLGSNGAAAAPVSYLVMELLEGESLAERLQRGALPMSDVLRYGSQIAGALDRAHKAGVIHRDLKPANIMLTKSGAKLLDFGLARTIEIAPAGNIDETIAREPSGEPGAAGTKKRAALTAEGTIVGTFQYMAPEQLEGESVDARTDIFALGAVLYEMATGHRAFDGATKTSIIAAIVDRDPTPMQQYQPLTPPAFEHVVSRCLVKDPSERWQSAHDIAEELSWIRDAGSQAGVAVSVTSRKRSRERISWILASILAAMLVAGSAYVLPKLQRAQRTFVSDIAPPRGMHFNAVGDEGGPLVVSPNGTMAVYSVGDASGTHLMLRSLITGAARLIDGSANGQFPFWSPDSRKIGFFTFGQLLRVDASGGSPVPIAVTSGARGGTWGANDVIVFTPSTQTSLFKVSAAGGNAVQITKVDPAQHTSHRWPTFLPDGKRFLYLACNHQDPTGSVNAVYLGDVDGGQPRMIMRGVSNAVWSHGYLLFSRGQTLYAQKVNRDLSLDGDPVAVAQDALYDAGVWRGAFSVADDGLLTYHSGRASVTSMIEWLDRRGNVISVRPGKDAYWDIDLSPTGQKLLMPIGDPLRELWIEDLQRATRTKVTMNGWANGGIWSPDGTTLQTSMFRGGKWQLVEKRVSGGERTLYSDSDVFVPRAVAMDGKSVFVDSPRGILRIPTDRPGEPAVIAGTGAEYATVSPNGKWLAYDSNENGHSDVFVTSLDRPEQKWQISADGGSIPRWRADGKELFFITPSNRLTAVPVTESGADLDFGSPQTLFAVNPRPQSRAYDVSPDGQRFIVNQLAEQESPTVVVLNDWRNRLP